MSNRMQVSVPLRAVDVAALNLAAAANNTTVSLLLASIAEVRAAEYRMQQPELKTILDFVAEPPEFRTERQEYKESLVRRLEGLGYIVTLALRLDAEEDETI